MYREILKNIATVEKSKLKKELEQSIVSQLNKMEETRNSEITSLQHAGTSMRVIPVKSKHDF